MKKTKALSSRRAKRDFAKVLNYTAGPTNPMPFLENMPEAPLANMPLYMDKLIETGNLSEAALDHIRKTKKNLTDLHRLNVCANTLWRIEILAILGMFAYSIIDYDGHAKAGEIAGPAMLAIAACIPFVLNKIDDKKIVLNSQIRKLQSGLQK